MAKQQVLTITVPYIPTIGADGTSLPLKPSDFDQYMERAGQKFILHEVQGSRLVYFEDEKNWVELGFNAIYGLER